MNRSPEVSVSCHVRFRGLWSLCSSKSRFHLPILLLLLLLLRLTHHTAPLLSISKVFLHLISSHQVSTSLPKNLGVNIHLHTYMHLLLLLLPCLPFQFSRSVSLLVVDLGVSLRFCGEWIWAAGLRLQFLCLRFVLRERDNSNRHNR